MIIDIEPIEMKADEFYSVALKERNLECFYCFLLQNGDQYSTMFEPKEMELFCPSKTVSEMMNNWEESIQREYEKYAKAVKTVKHPFWRKTILTDDGVKISVLEDLNKESLEAFQMFKDIEEKKIGKLKFVKFSL